jgi:hypothetical protein
MMPHEDKIDPASVISSRDVYHDVCIACRERFELGPHALEFYRIQGFELPKRCYRCREARRRARSPEARPWPNTPTR